MITERKINKVLKRSRKIARVKVGLRERVRKFSKSRRETREAILKVETAKRDAAISKKAGKLSKELGVPLETAKKYVQSQKVRDLRAARTAQVRKRITATAKATQKRRSSPSPYTYDPFWGFPSQAPKRKKKKRATQAKRQKGQTIVIHLG